MDALGTTASPSPGSTGLQPNRELPEERAPRLAWVLFLLLGLPFLVMATLTFLAAARIYVEPLRMFWQPWPPDVLKPFIGISAFAGTLAYLVYRIGRSRGFHSGALVGLAAGRNLAEGWKPPSERVSQPPPPALIETGSPPQDAPVAPLEATSAEPPPPVESTPSEASSGQ